MPAPGLVWAEEGPGVLPLASLGYRSRGPRRLPAQTGVPSSPSLVLSLRRPRMALRWPACPRAPVLCLWDCQATTPPYRPGSQWPREQPSSPLPGWQQEERGSSPAGPEDRAPCAHQSSKNAPHARPPPGLSTGAWDQPEKSGTSVRLGVREACSPCQAGSSPAEQRGTVAHPLHGVPSTAPDFDLALLSSLAGRQTTQNPAGNRTCTPRRCLVSPEVCGTWGE